MNAFDFACLPQHIDGTILPLLVVLPLLYGHTLARRARPGLSARVKRGLTSRRATQSKVLRRVYSYEYG